MATRQQTLGMMTLVALALAVSSFTAFRLPGLPLGLSEFLLVAAIIVHIPLGFGIYSGNSPNRFVPFLALLFAATLPGYITTLMVDGSFEMAHYGLLSSLYVLVLFAYLHFGFDHSSFDLNRVGQMFLLFSTVYFGVIALLAVLEPTMVYRQDNIEDLIIESKQGNEEIELAIRLVGFAANPNQLGMHALICCFFALQLRQHLRFITFAVCFGAAAAIGIMSKSDAFLFALVALVGTSLYMGIVFKGSIMAGIMLIVPSLVIGLLLLNPIVDVIQEIASTKDQNLTRYNLWENGIAAGLERPFFGLGPGVWSGYGGPREFEEAHNTAIDHFSIGGLVGLALLLIGTATLLIRTLFSKNSVLLGGVMAILVFSTFHYVMRQPILWFMVYYIIQSAWPGRVVARGKRGRGRQRRTYRPRARNRITSDRGIFNSSVKIATE